MRLLLVLLLLVSPGGVLRADDKKGDDSHEHGEAHQPTSTHSFADVEKWKQVFDDPSRDSWQMPAEIPAALGLGPGMTIADIGAGTGYFQRYFAEAVGPEGRVFSVDVEPTLVDQLVERAIDEQTPNVVAVLADTDNPRLPDASVDVVFICNTWHHIGDRIEYLGVLARALAPDGVVAVIDFKKESLPVGPGADHKIAREVVFAEFEEAGWELVRESDLLPYQYFLIFSPPSAE